MSHRLAGRSGIRYNETDYSAHPDTVMIQPSREPTLDDVQRALALSDFDHERAWQRMVPRQRVMHRPPDQSGEAHPAGVLVLIYPQAGRLMFVLTRRSEVVASHKGQISLPGGSQEIIDPGPVDTALRETCEEIDVCREDIQIIGALTPLYVSVSDFVIHPFIGYMSERPAFRPATNEVAEIIEMPLHDLLDPSIKTSEHWTLHGYEMEVPFYRVGKHVVWGATAIILSEFEGRLAAVMGIE
jgi:8-oxo-dGTP pyrophosphatase MutT (NUDIX family)